MLDIYYSTGKSGSSASNNEGITKRVRRWTNFEIIFENSNSREERSAVETRRRFSDTPAVLRRDRDFLVETPRPGTIFESQINISAASKLNINSAT